MPKSSTITLRIEDTMKTTLRNAADHVGESLTDFVTRAAGERATKVLARPRGALPTYFGALVARAASGGEGSWQSVGRQLARGAASELVNDLEEGAFEKEIRRLDRLARRVGPRRPTVEELDAILSWFEEHLPRCLEMVPARRRAAFANGVIEAGLEGEIEP
jgi:hypothetical protein